MRPQTNLLDKPMTELMTVQDHAPIVKNTDWPDESATQAFAIAMASQPGIADAFVELRGELGAGKTTFVRHLLGALGVPGRIKSPTYAVVEPYSLPNGLAISHFDFFRFNDPDEWEEAGFRDIFASPGLKLVEWPEKAGAHLPQPDLLIEIAARGDESRAVTLHAYTPAGRGLIA